MIDKEHVMSVESQAAEAGIGLGAVLAIVLSFETNHSILYAIVHSLFGWIYVVYHAATY